MRVYSLVIGITFIRRYATGSRVRLTRCIETNANNTHAFELHRITRECFPWIHTT